MNNYIIDSLAVRSDVEGAVSNVASSACEFNVWTAVAMVEFVAVLLLSAVLLKNRGISNDMEIKKKAISRTVDFGNVVNSAFHANELYNQLKVKCHPDRFVNDNVRNAIALEIFQMIGKSKNDVKALQALKQRAIDELGVKF